MNDSRNKILLFALGITIGVMAGGAFVYINSVKSGEKNVPDNFIEQVADRVYKLLSREKQMAEAQIKEQAPEIVPVNVSVPVKTDIDSVTTSNEIEILTDSLQTDSIENITELSQQEENIVVRKDELLSVVPAEYVNLSKNNENTKSDSLAAAVAGIKSVKANESISVEFWQSPINYKGYKASRNKVAIYGLPVAGNLKVFELNDGIYLKHEKNFYHLTYSNEYKALEKVSDPELLNLIQTKK